MFGAWDVGEFGVRSAEWRMRRVFTAVFRTDRNRRGKAARWGLRLKLKVFGRLLCPRMQVGVAARTGRGGRVEGISPATSSCRMNSTARKSNMFKHVFRDSSEFIRWVRWFLDLPRVLNSEPGGVPGYPRR